MKPWIFWTFVFVSCPVSQADDWGSIHGQIVVEGEIPQKRNVGVLEFRWSQKCC